jgi:hypothetical protein
MRNDEKYIFLIINDTTSKILKKMLPCAVAQVARALAILVLVGQPHECVFDARMHTYTSVQHNQILLI